MTKTEIIVLAPLFVVGTAIGLWELHQIRVAVRHAKIIEEDGREREPTNHERMAIAEDLSHRTGEHFPVLVTGGILLLVIVWVTLRLCGLIPVDH